MELPMEPEEKEPCERCGSDYAVITNDPYDLDDNGIVRECWLCDECYLLYADEI